MSSNNKAFGPFFIIGGGSGKKAPYGAADGTSMAAATITSAVVPCAEFDNIAIQLSWAGTSPVGTAAVQASLDYGDPINAGSPTWTAITLPVTPSVSGNTGSILIDLNQISFPWIRVVYTKTSGTGTLTGYVSGKGV